MITFKELPTGAIAVIVDGDVIDAMCVWYSSESEVYECLHSDFNQKMITQNKDMKHLIANVKADYRRYYAKSVAKTA